MRYAQIINEAVMHVPNAIRKPVMDLITSTMCGLLLLDVDTLKTKGDENSLAKLAEKEELINTLMNKYKVQPMSEDQLRSLKNRSINVKVDAQKFISELQNMRLSDEQESKIRNLLYNPIMLHMYYDGAGHRGVYTRYDAKKEGHAASTIGVDVFGTSRSNLQMWAKTIIGVADHELQHFMQYNVLQILNSKDKQFKSAPDTGDKRDDYINSPIEFGPHIKNMLSEFETTVLNAKINGKLNVSNKSQFIKDTLVQIVTDQPNNADFIARIKKHDEAGWRKIWTTLMSKSGKFLDTVLDDDNEVVMYSISDLKSTEVDASVNVMKCIIDELEKEGYKPRGFGRDIANIQEVSIIVEGCAITFTKLQSAQYQITARYKMHKASCVLDAKKTLKFLTNTFSLGYSVDPVDVLGSINLYSNPHNMEPKDLSTVQDIFDEVATMFGAAPAMTSLEGDVLKLTIDGLEMFARIDEGSIELQCEDPFLYFKFSLSNADQFFHYILRSFNEDKDNTLLVLAGSMTIMEAIFGMADILGI